MSHTHSVGTHWSLEECEEVARRVRLMILEMTNRAQSAHVGGSLSIVEILILLYGQILRLRADAPDWTERDRFILSKGHASAALYAVLAERGLLRREWLESFYKDEGRLAGHVTSDVPWVELSTGSLGHGLPVACGMALAHKRDNKDVRVYCLISDGECDEGSTWEASLFAPQHKLDNLVCIVDYNKVQSFGKVKDVLDLDPLAAKWRDFRWEVREVDGHNLVEVRDALAAPPAQEKPVCIIAHTMKGKGVSFMEGTVLWHYRIPAGEELERAVKEIKAR